MYTHKPSPIRRRTSPTHLIASIAIKIASILGVMGMLYIAYYRKFNFDEWLVIRSGWLIENSIDNSVHFLMPWTKILGYTSYFFESPDLLLTGTRVFVGITVISLLAIVFHNAYQKKTNNTWNPWIATTICLASGAFVSHAIEIRYDAVLLICWLSCWTLINSSPNRHKATALGTLIGILLLHHWKGLFFGFGAVVFIWYRSEIWRLYRIYVTAGIFLVVSAWFIFIISSGLISEQAKHYAQFLTIGHDFPKVGAYEALKKRLQMDFTWWAIVVPLFAMGTIKSIISRQRASVFWWLLTPTAFIAVHPRPWDYMLVPIVPFISILAADGLSFLGRIRLTKGHQSTLTLAFTLILAYTVLDQYQGAFKKSLHHDAEILKTFQIFSTEKDTVLDPAGVLYYIKPSDKEWYLDSLFLNEAVQGRWFQSTLTSPLKSSVIVWSYRIDWLPQKTKETLRENYTSACGWLWLKKTDLRLEEVREKCPYKLDRPLQNYWGY